MGSYVVPSLSKACAVPAAVTVSGATPQKSCPPIVSKPSITVVGIMDMSQCQGGAACRGGAQCLAHGLWADLNAKMAEFLNAQSLQSIKEKSLKEHAHHGEVREQPIIVHITEPKS